MKNILRNYLKKFNKNYQADFLLKNEFKYFKNSKKILDLGCGKGDFLKIAPHRIIGIDTNKRSILSCRKQKLSAFLVMLPSFILRQIHLMVFTRLTSLSICTRQMLIKCS